MVFREPTVQWDWFKHSNHKYRMADGIKGEVPGVEEKKVKDCRGGFPEESSSKLKHKE